jgi:hypothetical protein
MRSSRNCSVVLEQLSVAVDVMPGDMTGPGFRDQLVSVLANPGEQEVHRFFAVDVEHF